MTTAPTTGELIDRLRAAAGEPIFLIPFTPHGWRVVGEINETTGVLDVSVWKPVPQLADDELVYSQDFSGEEFNVVINDAFVALRNAIVNEMQEGIDFLFSRLPIEVPLPSSDMIDWRQGTDAGSQ